MSGAPFDPAHVRTLATILAETGLTEIEIESKDGRIRVVRAHPPAAVAAAAPAPFTAVVAAPVTAAVSAPPIESEDEDLSRHPGAILSPMVGVAYLSPDPASPAFVTVGQPVIVGQTLLLIEAMKTFNQIRAPRAGFVKRILFSSGAPIEYGEPLMILE